MKTPLKIFYETLFLIEHATYKYVIYIVTKLFLRRFVFNAIHFDNALIVNKINYTRFLAKAQATRHMRVKYVGNIFIFDNFFQKLYGICRLKWHVIANGDLGKLCWRFVYGTKFGACFIFQICKYA